MKITREEWLKERGLKEKDVMENDVGREYVMSEPDEEGISHKIYLENEDLEPRA